MSTNYRLEGSFKVTGLHVFLHSTQRMKDTDWLREFGDGQWIRTESLDFYQTIT